VEYKGTTYENITLPKDLAFQVNYTDVVVETAWKLLLHTCEFLKSNMSVLQEISSHVICTDFLYRLSMRRIFQRTAN